VKEWFNVVTGENVTVWFVNVLCEIHHLRVVAKCSTYWILKI